MKGEGESGWKVIAKASVHTVEEACRRLRREVANICGWWTRRSDPGGEGKNKSKGEN